MSLGLGVAGANVAVDQYNKGQEFERTKKLMDIQNNNQRMLNQQGHDLSFDMWNKTNYSAQRDHMKKAGLNVGLMYGGGGAGGGTTSQGSGGGAGSGSAPKAGSMDIANAALIKSQVDVNKSQAEKNQAEAEATSGYKGDVARGSISEMKARIAQANSQTEINKIIAEFKGEEMSSGIELNKEKSFSEGAFRDKTRQDIAESKSRVIKMSLEKLNIEMDTRLKEANLHLTQDQRLKIGDEVAMMWANLALAERNTSNAEAQTAINEFNAVIKANFPGISNVAGAAIIGAAMDAAREMGLEVKDPNFSPKKGYEKPKKQPPTKGSGRGW